MKFADAEFSYLKELLDSIDVTLARTNAQIIKLDVWDRGTLCDKGEYFIGVGFCAMQQYLFNTLRDVEIDPGLARELGPKSKKGDAVAKLIHSAANYWKHEPEWHYWLSELQARSQKTVDTILHGRDSADHPLSDLLADLCGENEFLLVNCLPYLSEWRLAVWEKVSKNL
ncbi:MULTISPECIES: hypothetical protein [Chromohalobacter]|uniref:hypothetical protein n=1 Tax=Chromohalobacter TaxID=42054 RepID=UPI001AAEB77A|nr:MULTISPECIES: hypothetical protein [Chromohalobacter]MCI0509453.1 hypothetical protein [Chromohalobacter sp.]MCI0593074.1 hypothetical protein [Chromohalobacter sp.]